MLSSAGLCFTTYIAVLYSSLVYVPAAYMSTPLPRAPTPQHYYTGEYHARRPCDPEGRCNIKGGGCGGGPVPTGSPVAAFSGYDSLVQQQQQQLQGSAGMAQGGEAVDFSVVDEDGDTGEGRGARPPSLHADSSSPEARPQRQGSESSACGGGEGLWWTCGAWSIMGRWVAPVHRKAPHGVF